MVSSRRLGWNKHERKRKAPCSGSSTVGDPTEDAELCDSTGTVPGSGDLLAATVPVVPARAVPAAIA